MDSKCLALAATGVTGFGALLLAICRRWNPHPVVQQLTFVSGLGYAIPGSVLALGLMVIGDDGKNSEERWFGSTPKRGGLSASSS